MPVLEHHGEFVNALVNRTNVVGPAGIAVLGHVVDDGGPDHLGRAVRVQEHRRQVRYHLGHLAGHLDDVDVVRQVVHAAPGLAGVVVGQEGDLVEAVEHDHLFPHEHVVLLVGLVTQKGFVQFVTAF